MRVDAFAYNLTKQGKTEMKNTSKIWGLAFAIGGLMVAQSAQAQTYRWTWNNDNSIVGNQVGQFKSAESTYRQEDGAFSFDYTIGRQAGTNKIANGFWLAISGGPNPKGIAGELAIFYFDASTATPVLTAYGYNGENGFTSYKDGSPAPGTQAPDKIASSLTTPNFIKGIGYQDLANGDRKFAISIEGSVINNYQPQNGNPNDWKGVAFDQKFGVWLHPVLDANFSYNQDGFIQNFTNTQNGWMDGSNLSTEAVPEPASMTILALGLAALARKRKNSR